MQQALLYLRNQRSGHIINISSIAGFAPGNGWSIYAASKFAVNGLSEALVNDLKPLGIHVTSVLSDWFRTSFAHPKSIVFGNKQIDNYQFIREGHQKFRALDGMLQGNPNKIADAFITLTNIPNTLVHFFLGNDAYDKTAQLTEEIKVWKGLSESTDF